MSKSNVISCKSAIDNLLYHDGRNDRLQTFAGNMFDPANDKGLIKKAMVNKITGSGIAFRTSLAYSEKQEGKESLPFSAYRHRQ